MVKKNKKICLLLAGGTILSDKEPFSVNTESDIKSWLEKMSELSIMADIEPVFITGEKDQLAGSSLWQLINREINKRFNDYGGFIVTSSVEQIIYNSLATSFALGNVNKPIIFTGSQLPIIDSELVDIKKKDLGGFGIKANLINAIQIATMDFPTVGLIFGNVFIKSTRIKRSAVHGLNIFKSVDGSYLAKIDFGISPQEKILKPTRALTYQNNFESDIIYLKYYPDLDLKKLQKSLTDCKGVIIELGTGVKLSEAELTALESFVQPVVLYNSFYLPKLNSDKVIILDKMTKEAVMVKLMWALGQTKDILKVKELMVNQVCGEFIQYR